jgi:ribosomal protein S18 acetylase RimI-like enzyme
MTPDKNSYQIDISDGIMLIKNQNTTIGYCRFLESGDIEYIYVNLAYRRQGYGRILIDEVKKITGKIGEIHQPVSPLGSQFFKGIGVGQIP